MGKLIIGDNMKKKKKNKKIKYNKKYLYLVAVLLLLTLSYLEVTNNIYIEKYLRDFLYSPTKFIKEESFIEDMNSEIENENTELKKMLEIESSLTDYDKIYATVISRNNSYWFNTITINKGINDGVEEGLAVVDYNGLVGKVEKVSLTTSEIKLITSNDKYNNVSVKIVGEDETNKILKSSDNKIIIEGINKSLNIKVGDKVITNGLTGSFPSGIIVGTISSIDRDYYNVSNIAKVSLSSNINNLRFVAVLKRIS